MICDALIVWRVKNSTSVIFKSYLGELWRTISYPWKIPGNASNPAAVYVQVDVFSGIVRKM